MASEKGDRQLAMFGSAHSEVRDRIKQLRLVRRWDQSTLGEKASVSTATISNIELGRVAPTREQIEGIANALGYSSEFLTSEIAMLPTTRPWLRAYADASKREADSRTSATALAAEYVRRLGLKPLPDLIPVFAGPVDDEAIEEAASEMRQLAQIDEDAVVTNAIRAAERLGCVVLPLESELGRHLGMSVRADQLPMVCVAKGEVPGDRQRWTVAHELGHLALHGNAAPPRDSREARRMENEAHRFAAAFLAPGDALIETLRSVGGSVTLRALAEIKAIWGVAIKALVHRFNELDIIDAGHARSLYKQISARKWTTDEPVDVPTETAQWFERTLIRKAGSDDLATACRHLAAVVGGNADDLQSFADWTTQPEAEVLSFSEHQERRRG
ncbi:MAG: XRE family transcriptional regulator [Actinomycetota bacterium]|nr:XRE family transcriptional regulator [Actinomycetota bacterium]